MYVCRRDRAKYQDYVNKLLFKRLSWIICYTRQAKILGEFLLLVKMKSFFHENFREIFFMKFSPIHLCKLSRLLPGTNFQKSPLAVRL